MDRETNQDEENGGKLTESGVAYLDEGDSGFPEPLENGGLGGVGRREVADEDGGGVAFASAGSHDKPADVARSADDQDPAPFLPRRRRRHVLDRQSSAAKNRGKFCLRHRKKVQFAPGH